MGLQKERADSGYATASAAMISLALAIVAVASMDQSRASLKAARADSEALQRDLDFDSASLEAVATIARSDGAGPFAWTIALPGGSGLEVRAEPEWQKVGPAQAKALTDLVLAQFKVKDAEAMRSAFSELASQTKSGAERVAKLDEAPLWRSCAQRFVSVFGGSSSVPTEAPTSPLASNGGGGRVGQVWRIVLTSPLGWTDERYVRFIGDAQRPASTLERVIRRDNKGADPCPSITS
jgi:hypothetical protein